MDHYFSEKPEIKSEKKTIKYTIQNKKFEFITDNGVFSKSKVDFGTDLMLNEFLKKNKGLEAKKIKILDIGCFCNTEVILSWDFDYFVRC